MKIKNARFIATGLLLLAATSAGLAQELDPRLKPLDHYVGDWDTAMLVNESTGESVKGTTTAQWILGGRFVQQSSTFATNAPFSVTSIMTFDAKKNTYRVWSFTSSGGASDGEGSWDAENRTMNWEVRDGAAGTTTRVTATFSEDGNTEDWLFVVEDPSGNTSTASGKNSRQAPKGAEATPQP